MILKNQKHIKILITSMLIIGIIVGSTLTVKTSVSFFHRDSNALGIYLGAETNPLYNSRFTIF